MTTRRTRATGLSISAWLLLMSATAAPVQGNTPSPAATNAPAHGNPALGESSLWLASSNIVKAAAPAGQSPGISRFQTLLESGRKLRQQNNYSAARVSLVTILESDAPDALQRTALLELALMAQEQGELARAQQVFAQYIRLFHDAVLQNGSVPLLVLEAQIDSFIAKAKAMPGSAP